MEGINQSDSKRIRKIQSDLIRIDSGEKFFYNCTVYENMGLIRPVNKSVILSNGNTEMQFDRHILTDKGRRIISAMV